MTARPTGLVFAARLRAAARTVGAARWYRARGTRHDVPIDPGPGTPQVGVVERLEVRDGTMWLSGWTSARQLQFSSEAATCDFRNPGQERARFDLTLAGARRLRIAADGDDGCRVATIGASARVLSLLKFGAFLAGIPFRHGNDLLAYVLRGESEAGRRLYALLLPEGAEHGLPRAMPGVFSEGGPPDPAPPIDIIVPVHNAAEALERCLDRLAAHTDPRHRVILVDDASSDPRVGPLLEAFRDGRPGTEILRHATNKGFVAAANAGLGMALGHAVLLNSDAFVVAGWLDRLIAPILADPEVASVTPMSNDAEILTIPVESAPAPLDDREIDRIDAAAARLNPIACRADLPTGIGFCMAMARPWLDRFPDFDPAFGPGYGEEVDWCRRAARAGARHVGIGNLFIGHGGAASFGAARTALVRRNNRRIARRHPEHDAEVIAFRRSDPLVGSRLALGLALLSGRKAVPVYLAHRQGGGAERWLGEEIEARLAAGGGCAVVRGGDVADEAILELHTAQGRTAGIVALADLARFLLVPARREIIYSCMVGTPDPLGLIETVLAARGDGDRFTVVFHDYFPLCPSYNLIGAGGAFCGLPGPEACAACYRRLPNLTGRRPAAISDWRDAWRGVLDRADGITVLSGDSRHQVLRVWPDLAPRLTVAPHRMTRLPEPVAAPPDGRPVIGVLGGIGFPKGAGVLRDLARLPDPRPRIVVIGKIDPAFFVDGLDVHGPYRPEEISDLARRYRIDRWLVPSIWPETFSYVVRECLATGLPVFGFDLGAQGEVLRDHPRGRVLPPGMPVKALARALAAPYSAGEERAG